MADIFSTVADDGDSADKCGEAAQRRAQEGRLVTMPGDAQPQELGGNPSNGEKKRDGAQEGGGDRRNANAGGSDDRPLAPVPPDSSAAPSSLFAPGVGGAHPSEVVVPLVEAPPAFGCVSLSGRLREMEDAVSLQPGFYFQEGDGRSPLHFFAVFDGHGGSHVSELCKERMHAILAEELRKATAERGGGEITDEEMKAALARSFRRVDELALESCTCGSEGKPCECEEKGVSMEVVGSTAVVAVVCRDRVVVANCGDSRAVLGRAGRAFALSSDQKPDRPDELARIEEAGGRVIYVNGARVLGILAMSRALGDGYLKPAVISEPEISITERTPEDEFLIIASDGLWDVLSNNVACAVARRCLRERLEADHAEDLGAKTGVDGVLKPHASKSYCSTAAALLTRLALARKSSDNISVIVVDLRK